MKFECMHLESWQMIFWWISQIPLQTLHLQYELVDALPSLSSAQDRKIVYVDLCLNTNQFCGWA